MIQQIPTIPDPNSQADRQWLNRLKKILFRLGNNTDNSALWNKYQSVFSAHYKYLMPPRYAASDIFSIEKTLQLNKQQVALLSHGKNNKQFRLHFYSLKPRNLDEYFPILGNLNLQVIDQVQFPLLVDGKRVFIKSFTITVTQTQQTSSTKLKCHLLDLIYAVLNNQVENDSLNKLLILTGLQWQEIDVIRAYRNYYLQLDHNTSIETFHNATDCNPQVVLHLFNYFEARFRPDSQWQDCLLREEQALFPLRITLLQALETVVDINHDRILRTLFNLIDATVRSNFHIRRNSDDYFVAFKINSLGVIDMPTPKPQNEIYVHAVDMEGIHLRGGKIARGGIRWSNRIDDFRTEILGLMQTQMCKNVLITPKGAKGGFIVKGDYDNAHLQEAGQRAYIIFIKGLLDLTDNNYQEKPCILPGIISYDDYDPYLVVAADKGTAQFSDLANSIAAHYNYWLDDAFASGGSNGYNHKKLGITARGAWESVKRHFRELGKDIQQQPFTVIGIGSMDGDVFGNAMLLSQMILLKAAFSGEHIFIDPEPENIQRAYLERKRLFDLAGSSWADYNAELISQGGGVFRRDCKDIPLSAEIKKWLGIRHNKMDGESLIRSLLQAPIELLWLGGIGTYVKASTESHSLVGDRNNDAVRIDATELQANVVGEGANLGFTQQARIEYSLCSGKMNTDAIDNSAGVDISDHEVNLKILLMSLFKQKKITDSAVLFNSLTESVCQSVLENNYKQTLCLSIEQLRCTNQIAAYLQIAEQLDAANYLDRNVESFANNNVLLARQPQTLTRPELSVLTAVSKMYLTEQLLEHGKKQDTDYFNNPLLAYFPQPIRKKYSEAILSHPLAKEISATCISNKIINQAGCLFLNLTDQDDNSLLQSCLCYLTFDLIVDAENLRQQLFQLDNKIESHHQYAFLQTIETLLLNICRWAITNEIHFMPTESTLSSYKKHLQEYKQLLQQEAEKSATYVAEIKHYQQTGLPNNLAENMYFFANMGNFPYLVLLSNKAQQPFTLIFHLHRELSTILELDNVFRQLNKITLHGFWEEKVYLNLLNDMDQITGKIIQGVLKENTNCFDYLSNPKRKPYLRQYQHILKKINSDSAADLMAYVALKENLAPLLENSKGKCE